MYNADPGLTTIKIIYGIIFSLVFVLLMKIGVFKDLYDLSAIFFKDFQQQNMEFFGRLKQDLDFVGNFGNLKVQNDQLLADNIKLISENSNLKNQINENKLISQQASFNPQYSYLPIRITKYKDNQTEVVLNKGSSDNVNLNDVLVYENFLVGYVNEINTNYSVARLIIDPRSKVAVMTQSSNLKGVGTGDGINSILMKQVPNEKKLEMSELILSAGTDGIFPYGLILGKLVNIYSQATDIEQSGQIIPEIKVKDLRDIFIIKNSQ